MMDYMTQQLQNECTISPQARLLKRYGMYSAALFYKNLNDTRERRASRVTRWAMEHSPLPEVKPGQKFYAGAGCNTAYCKIPGDDTADRGLFFVGNGDTRYNREKFQKLFDEVTDPRELHMLRLIQEDSEAGRCAVSPGRYNHGGLHYVPDFEFIMQNGFMGYAEKIEKRLSEEKNPKKKSFLEGMQDVFAGVMCFLKRSAEYLAEEAEKTKDSWICRMAEGVKNLAQRKPESFYEAYLASEILMGLTAFEPGRVDQYLYPFYEKDLAEGKTSKEEAVELLEAMFADIDAHVGHPGVTHTTIGGTDRNGNGVYNDLTEAAIIAIRGHRTPNVTLRIRDDMPQKIWDAAIYNISKGYSHPALYNDKLVLDRLVEDYEIPYEDAVNYVFGGCSELMIQGKSTCNSTWVAYNLLDILEHTMYNDLPDCESFEDFLRQYKDDVTSTIAELADVIRLREYSLAMNSSDTLKSLFTCGCIEHGKGYLEGGSQYNFDSTNLYGGTNAINSLYTIKLVLDGKLPFGKEELLEAMADNYKGHEKVQLLCRRIPKFGNGNEEVEAIAHDVMDTAFSAVMKENTYRRNEDYTGRFMPGIILWTDWISCGEKVGATPDGRAAGEATVDSAGPMQGTDENGPTTSMLATLSLPQEKCAGTCVMNLRLDPSNFKTEEGRRKVQALIQSYHAQGGCQLQINVVDGDALREALKDPENHKDIIVRVGGFSDNFVMLSSSIQEQILKRTEHSI